MTASSSPPRSHLSGGGGPAAGGRYGRYVARAPGPHRTGPGERLAPPRRTPAGQGHMSKVIITDTIDRGSQHFEKTKFPIFQ